MKLFFIEIVYVFLLITFLNKFKFLIILKEYFLNFKKILIILKNNYNNDNLIKLIIPELNNFYINLFKLMLILFSVLLFSYLCNYFYKGFIKEIFSFQFLIICLLLLFIINFIKNKF
jgi:hypothetical protein